MSMFLNSYPKPALGYLYVKDLLGDEQFTKALHYYINQWHGRHPMPHDFFNCMNTGAGRNLNWFWKRWFFDDGVPDLAIKSVRRISKSYEITVESKGTKPVPIDLDIRFTEGPLKKVHRNISVWESGNSIVTIVVPAEGILSYVSLGSLYVPDINKGDNLYIK
jgi:aminopeptidase N